MKKIASYLMFIAGLSVAFGASASYESCVKGCGKAAHHCKTVLKKPTVVCNAEYQACKKKCAAGR